MKNGLMTRGVLIDIPKLKGVEYLEPGTAIYPEDLDAWEKKTGIKISSGDSHFLRYRGPASPVRAGKAAAGRINSAYSSA
jgi:hypothetical protein